MKSQENSSPDEQEGAEASSISQESHSVEIPSEDTSQRLKDDVEYEFPLADSISTSTLVNLLIRKGFISVEELIEAESKNLEFENTAQQYTRIRVRRKKKTKWKHLKKLMSRRRWTRRLATKLFGWKWKRIKTNLDN